MPMVKETSRWNFTKKQRTNEYSNSYPK